jgi:hypothetical protein
MKRTKETKSYLDSLTPKQAAIFKKVEQETINKGRALSRAEVLESCNIKKDTVRNSFVSFERLQALLIQHSPQVRESLIRENILDEARLQATDKVISKNKMFILTGIHSNAETINHEFLKTLDLMAEKLDAKIMLVPIGKANKGKEWDGFDRDLVSRYHWLTKRVQFNSNLTYLPIRTSDNDKNPIGGLKKLCHQFGSIIIGGTRQSMESVPVTPGKMARVLHSTGAVSKPKLIKDEFWSNKNDYALDADHKYSCIVVEVVDDRVFFTSPLDADAYNRVTFRGYTYDGKKKKLLPVAGPRLRFSAENPISFEAMLQYEGPEIFTGDWHNGHTDQEVREAIFRYSLRYGIRVIGVNDFSDGYSTNRHIKDKLITKFLMWEKGYGDVSAELESNARELDELTSRYDAVVHYGSNHGNWLYEWLEKGDYEKDIPNKKIGTILAAAMMEGHDPFRYAMEKIFKIKQPWKILWVSEKDSFNSNGVHKFHGHIGNSGGAFSFEGAEIAYGPNASAHGHAKAKWGRSVRAGTSTSRGAEYTAGGIAWTQTSIVTHQNGTCEFVDFIDGKFAGDDRIEKPKKKKAA